MACDDRAMLDAPVAGEPHVLDARGQRCPLPVIRLGRLVRELPDGTLVRLLATDPAARSDVPAFCRMRGHELVQVTEVRGGTELGGGTGTGNRTGGAGGDAAGGGDHTAYLVRVSATAAAGVR